MRCLLVCAAVALVWSGCGYVGEPLPPALNLPQRVTDLSAVENGVRIVVQFTSPTHTTEGLLIRTPLTAELRVGTATAPLQPETWARDAKVVDEIPAGEPVTKYVFPAAEWIGKTVVIGVRVSGANGRAAGWSNLVPLFVVAPLEVPAGLTAQASPQGVRLTWRGSSPRYRIYRRSGEDTRSTMLGEAEKPEYLDATSDYGKTYHYAVQGMQATGDVRAESGISEETAITPQDTFPPAIPVGLAALASTGSIELVWERNTEPDLAGYRVYRAEVPGPFARLTEAQQPPSFSDRKIEPGKTYRYAVSAVDQLGNESQMCSPVEIKAP